MTMQKHWLKPKTPLHLVRWTPWCALATTCVWRPVNLKRDGTMSNVPFNLVCCFVGKTKPRTIRKPCIVNLIQKCVTCGVVCSAFAVNQPRFNRAIPPRTPIGCLGPVPRKSATSFGGPINRWVPRTGPGFMTIPPKRQTNNQQAEPPLPSRDAQGYPRRGYDIPGPPPSSETSRGSGTRTSPDRL